MHHNALIGEPELSLARLEGAPNVLHMKTTACTPVSDTVDSPGETQLDLRRQTVAAKL